jgi:hypothetical protein
MLSKVATLPFRRSLEDFDFGFQPSVKERHLRELASCAFIERNETREWAKATWPSLLLLRLLGAGTK